MSRQLAWDKGFLFVCVSNERVDGWRDSDNNSKEHFEGCPNSVRILLAGVFANYHTNDANCDKQDAYAKERQDPDAPRNVLVSNETLKDVASIIHILHCW